MATDNTARGIAAKALALAQQALDTLNNTGTQSVASVPVGTAYAASYGAAVTPVVGTGSEVME